MDVSIYIQPAILFHGVTLEAMAKWCRIDRARLTRIAKREICATIDESNAMEAYLLMHAPGEIPFAPCDPKEGGSL